MGLYLVGWAAWPMVVKAPSEFAVTDVSSKVNVENIKSKSSAQLADHVGNRWLMIL